MCPIHFLYCRFDAAFRKNTHFEHFKHKFAQAAKGNSPSVDSTAQTRLWQGAHAECIAEFVLECHMAEAEAEKDRKGCETRVFLLGQT
mmetsp:Transcript_44297/g.72072  ORF Transcript_44297/g.72072 Transcript_44297/m.72072 type:complete len:88 (+) Transcript_44297:1450-1713(+)